MQVLEKKDRRAKPFLKWAGGKSKLLDELFCRVPAQFKTYHEPFLGGGALFFALEPKTAVLSDINQNLIFTYQAVRDALPELIEHLSEHRYEKEYYYAIRSQDRTEEFQTWSPARKAARLIYLNKSCFNGLYRVNQKGEFNTPFGRYRNPTLLDEVNLLACSEALQGIKIETAHFSSVIERAGPSDFVYLDPPYVPLSKTASFTAYSEEGFGEKEQESLRDICSQLNQRGVHFLLSNSATEKVHKLYKDFRIETVSTPRAINSKASARGKIEEVLVSNYY